MNRFRQTIPLLMLASVPFLGGCYRQIVYPGTRAYDQRVATMAISPAQAAEVARDEAMRREPRVTGRGDPRLRGLSVSDTPDAVIDRAYLFPIAPEHKLRGLRLTGYYVNGDDGRVRFRRGFLAEANFLTGEMPSKVPHGAYVPDE